MGFVAENDNLLPFSGMDFPLELPKMCQLSGVVRRSPLFSKFLIKLCKCPAGVKRAFTFGIQFNF
jgi:hypothetical protein